MEEWRDEWLGKKVITPRLTGEKKEKTPLGLVSLVNRHLSVRKNTRGSLVVN